MQSVMPAGARRSLPTGAPSARVRSAGLSGIVQSAGAIIGVMSSRHPNRVTAISLPQEDGADAARQSARQAEVAEALSRVLPASALLVRREDTAPYECDGLTAFKAVPMAVVLPENEAQLVAVLKVCHALGCRWSPAAPGRDCRAARCRTGSGSRLSLAKFNRILKVDPLVLHGRRAMRRAQSGDQRGGSSLRPVLRARPEQPDRLHDRRQRRGELRRRALPEIRPDAAQRAARPRASPPRASRSSSAPRRSMRRDSICWRW